MHWPRRFQSLGKVALVASLIHFALAASIRSDAPFNAPLGDLNAPWSTGFDADWRVLEGQNQAILNSLDRLRSDSERRFEQHAQSLQTRLDVLERSLTWQRNEELHELASVNRLFLELALVLIALLVAAMFLMAWLPMRRCDRAIAQALSLLNASSARWLTAGRAPPLHTLLHILHDPLLDSLRPVHALASAPSGVLSDAAHEEPVPAQRTPARRPETTSNAPAPSLDRDPKPLPLPGQVSESAPPAATVFAPAPAPVPAATSSKPAPAPTGASSPKSRPLAMALHEGQSIIFLPHDQVAGARKAIRWFFWQGWRKQAAPSQTKAARSS